MKKAFINTPEYQYYDSETLKGNARACFIVIDENGNVVQPPEELITSVYVPLQFEDTTETIMTKIVEKIREIYNDNTITIHI